MLLLLVGEPTPGSEDCGVIQNDNDIHKAFLDADCDADHYPLCEKVGGEYLRLRLTIRSQFI